jgi:arylsulfatase A-like enzyme
MSRLFVPLVIVGLLTFVFIERISQPEPKGPRPNILLIVADDLGYGDFGCYGCRDIHTPAADRLAKEGVRLTDFYASPVCTPTRASLITGRYPQNFGFDWVIGYREKDRGLPAKGASLPALLKKEGYATALIGKWHLGYRDEFAPNAHGFDEFFGFLGADLDYYSHKDALGDPGLYHNTKLVEEKGYLTDLITEHSLEFLKKTKQPFFLEVTYNAPHFPFQPPDKPEDVRNPRTHGPEIGTRADYVKMVERMEQGIGKLLDALDENHLTKETLVIYFSDNGGDRLADNGPLFHGKYTLWEGGVRVPCIMRWPSVLPAKQDSSQPAIVMDLTATMLAAAGATIPKDDELDGEDIVPLLTGKKPAEERTFFWRLPRPNDHFGQRAVRKGKWKYVYDRETDMLFDLEKDIGERHNVAIQFPDVVKKLRAELGDWEKKLPPTR